MTWTNIGMDPPNLIIFFKADFIPKTTLENFWMKIYIPFQVNVLNVEWGQSSGCYISQLTFQPAYEEKITTDESYTYFYLQLTNSIYEPYKIFSLRFKPDLFIDFTGFTESLGLEIISSNNDGYIIYAYNYCFNNFYGMPKPSSEMIIVDETEDSQRHSLNKVIWAYLTVQVKENMGERILIMATGDYKFAYDVKLTCTTVADAANQIDQVKSDDYSCDVLKEYSGNNFDFLQYTWTNNQTIPSGKYKLKFTIQTPKYGGTYSLRVMTASKTGPRIYSMANLSNIFSTLPSQWATGYPKINYSFGLSAMDQTVPSGIRLYSMGNGFTQIYNSLVF